MFTNKVRKYMFEKQYVNLILEVAYIVRIYGRSPKHFYTVVNHQLFRYHAVKTLNH